VRSVAYSFLSFDYPFLVGGMKLEPDGGIGPSTSKFPSVVLEVGDTASLTQLEFDASLWPEHLSASVSQFSFWDSLPTYQYLLGPTCCSHILRSPLSSLSQLSNQLWKRFPLPHPTAAQEMQASKVWEADWTHQATPLYILLSDIFGPEVPAEYGNNDRVFLNSVRLRERILDSYTWPIEAVPLTFLCSILVFNTTF